MTTYLVKFDFDVFEGDYTVILNTGNGIYNGCEVVLDTFTDKDAANRYMREWYNYTKNTIADIEQCTSLNAKKDLYLQLKNSLLSLNSNCSVITALDKVKFNVLHRPKGFYLGDSLNRKLFRDNVILTEGGLEEHIYKCIYSTLDSEVVDEIEDYLTVGVDLGNKFAYCELDINSLVKDKILNNGLAIS